MNIRIYMSLFLVLAGAVAFSQQAQEGSLTIYQDERVDSLISNYVQINEINPGIEGWRIEIFFEAGNYSKKLAMEAKSKFVEQYPEIPSYLIFQQPYYKVRVGDYRTKMEAEKFLNSIEADYPQAFVVTDEINYPRFD